MVQDARRSDWTACGSSLMMIASSRTRGLRWSRRWLAGWGSRGWSAGLWVFAETGTKMEENIAATAVSETSHDAGGNPTGTGSPFT